MTEILTIDTEVCALTSDHAAASYGIPVVLGGDGVARGPAETCRLRIEVASDEAIAALAAAGYEFDDCR